EDVHVVDAYGVAGLTRLHNVRDEGGPVLGPVLLHYLNQDEVQLVQEEGVAGGSRGALAQSEDEVHDEGLDALSLHHRERLPSGLDGSLED
ncbi:hypothetical protein PMAYCL1PPCAC_28193, partial [Pristionchus mayeri]